MKEEKMSGKKKYIEIRRKPSLTNKVEITHPKQCVDLDLRQSKIFSMPDSHYFKIPYLHIPEINDICSKQLKSNFTVIL
jgi:hypothetical protein